MKTGPYAHLGDETLLRYLHEMVSGERRTTSAVVALIAEVDARKLYLPAGYPSMRSYCVHVLGFSKDEAHKRIEAARAAQDFPEILRAIADGRLHLTAVVLLSARLTAENADELIAAAAHRSKSEIREFLDRRFPEPDLLATGNLEVVPEPPGFLIESPPEDGEVVPEPPESLIESPPAEVEVVPEPPRSLYGNCPLPKGLSQVASAKLRYLGCLLSHQVRSGSPAELLERVFDAAIAHLERRKLGAGSKSRTDRRPRPGSRHIPAHVKWQVWQRDGGRCTFVGTTGQRCPSERLLEFDHVQELARGGEATVANLRLRCRAHNQYVAERTYGKDFMSHKREQARRAADERRAAKACAVAEASVAKKRAAEAERIAAAAAAERARETDVTPWLRTFGFRAEQLRRAAAHCESLPDAPLEERVKAALRFLAPKAHTIRPGPAAPSP